MSFAKFNSSFCTIFIVLFNLGGAYRTCLVSDERQFKPGVMRPSGDLGHIDDLGRLIYDGRCDRQVKRFGHRINLDHIQQVIDAIIIYSRIIICTFVYIPHIYSRNFSRVLIFVDWSLGKFSQIAECLSHTQ